VNLCNVCTHVPAHVVDLTWQGAAYTLACFFAGLWAGRTSVRR
jgi:hypothetical protein